MKLRTYTLREDSCGAARDKTGLYRRTSTARFLRPAIRSETRSWPRISPSSEVGWKSHSPAHCRTMKLMLGHWVNTTTYILRFLIGHDLHTSPAILLLSNWTTLMIQTLRTDSFMHWIDRLRGWFQREN